MNTQLKDLVSALQNFSGANQGALGQIVSRKDFIAQDFHNKNLHNINSQDQSRSELALSIFHDIPHVIEASMLIHAFAIWDAHAPTFQELESHISTDDLEKFRAFKHVRNSVSHDIAGKRRLKRQEQALAFENLQPFCNIKWDRQDDTINLSRSNVATQSVAFLMELAKKLVPKYG